MTSDDLRPLRPAELGAGSSHTRDLAGLAAQLMNEPAFAETGRNAATLVHAPGLRVTVTTIAKGTALRDHTAGRPTHLTMLSGELDWRDTGRDEPVRLSAGHAVTFGGKLTHSVEAVTDAAFVLVLGGDE